MATHSSNLAWKIPWTEEPGRLQSMRNSGGKWIYENDGSALDSIVEGDDGWTYIEYTPLFFQET